MIIFFNILLTFFYWGIGCFILKKVIFNTVFRCLVLIILFLGYIIGYFYLFDGYFNYYNYIIVIFTFVYTFIYK